MGIWKDAKRQVTFQSAQSRVQEASLYAEVMDELERGERDKGLWGKALSISEGDETKANARYIKLRVAALEDMLKVGADLMDVKRESLPETQIKRLEAKRSRINLLIALIWISVAIAVGAFFIAINSL